MGIAQRNARRAHSRRLYVPKTRRSGGGAIADGDAAAAHASESAFPIYPLHLSSLRASNMKCVTQTRACRLGPAAERRARLQSPAVLIVWMPQPDPLRTRLTKTRTRRKKKIASLLAAQNAEAKKKKPASLFIKRQSTAWSTERGQRKVSGAGTHSSELESRYGARGQSTSPASPPRAPLLLSPYRRDHEHARPPEADAGLQEDAD